MDCALRYGIAHRFSDDDLPARQSRCNVKADSNCLYRAMAKFISGNENQFMPVREGIAAHMTTSRSIYDTLVISNQSELNDEELDQAFKTYTTKVKTRNQWSSGGSGDWEIGAFCAIVNCKSFTYCNDGTECLY